MALVKHKGSDNWYWRLYVNGKPKQGSCFTTNKSIAARYEAKKRTELQQQALFGVKQSLTIQQALQLYLDSCENSGEYDNIATRVNKLLGTKQNKVREVVEIHGLDQDKQFHKITDGDIQRLVFARRQEGVADATILAELTALSQAIKLVKRLQYAVPEVDFAAIKRGSSVKPSKGRDRFITAEEEQRLLAQMSGDTKDLTTLLFSTGARYSEIAELPWTAIDINRREIHIYRSKVKNTSVFPMTTAAYEVLKRRKEAATGDHVFQAKDGSARKYAPKSFNTAAVKAGLPWVTHHVVRHTVASRLAQAGVALYDISKVLGHSTITMTQRYAHLVPNQSIANAVAALETGAR